MKIFEDLGALAEASGTDLGAGRWVAVDQERIDTFAAATDDHQWIHVDPAEASKGPFGTTIAHGFLTLSLLPSLLNELYRVDGVRMAINYGLDKVRFVSPVPVGSEIRVHSRIAEVTPLENAAQAVFETTIEIAGADRPAAVIRSIIRYLA